MPHDTHESFLPDDDETSRQETSHLSQPGEEIQFEDYGFSLSKTLLKFAPHVLGGMMFMALIVGGWYAATSPQGASCDSPYDCRSTMCLVSSINAQHAFCADSCATDEDCPDAHLCLAQAGARACVPRPSKDDGETCHFSFECLSQECLVEGTRMGNGWSPGLGGNPIHDTVNYESHGTCVEAGTVARREEAQRKAREAQRELEQQLQQLRNTYVPSAF